MSASTGGQASQAGWDSEKYPATTSKLMASLRELRDTNPKAVRSNMDTYPASVYAASELSVEKNGESFKLPDRHITSWKMTEHLYRSPNNQFPTLARGLFTEELISEHELPSEALNVEGERREGQTRERIVARGYDKFFNIDEVQWTNWKYMQSHTKPPYYLTLKSNGCLILVSALSPSHLLVTSKHALGVLDQGAMRNGDAVMQGMRDLSLKNGDGQPLSEKAKGKQKEGHPAPGTLERDLTQKAHAEVGRKWLRKSLASSGKTEEELASRLWQNNLTAVLELCDDEFEEHVLATPEHWTGLHLHGLNHNTPHFATEPPSDVASFAEEFGFIPTKYVELNTLDEVKSFTDKVEREGTWEGEQIEGFVVRSTVAESTENIPGKPPYRPGAPFFFKIKFEEPYLLYRQWRELTRVMLPLIELQNNDATEDTEKGRRRVAGMDPAEAIWKKIRSKASRQEVAVYADWCARIMREEPQLFDDYDRGVVRVRERFLEWTRGEGAKAWKQAQNKQYKLVGLKTTKSLTPKEDHLNGNKPKKWLIVPIAVPGCGKTLVGVGLTKLFGFGHTQSDDITAKKTGPTFLKNILAEFKTHDVVFADRNNHIFKHYNELNELRSNKAMSQYDLQLIGIVWDVETPPYHRLLRILSERVVERGDNHRTLRPADDNTEHEKVISMFLRKWQRPDPEDFTSLIWVNVEDAPKICLDKVLDGLIPVMGLNRPSSAAIDEALRAAKDYKISGPIREPKSTLPPTKATRYYGIALELSLSNLLGGLLEPDDQTASSAKTIFERLRTSDRINRNPHLTICHEKMVIREKEKLANQETDTSRPVLNLWNRCEELSREMAQYQAKLTHLVWDDRAMAIAATELMTKDGKLVDFNAPQYILDDLHVTVGTISEEVEGYEASKVVRKLKEAMITMNGDAPKGLGEAVQGGGGVSWKRLDNIPVFGRMMGFTRNQPWWCGFADICRQSPNHLRDLKVKNRVQIESVYANHDTSHTGKNRRHFVQERIDIDLYSRSGTVSL